MKIIYLILLFSISLLPILSKAQTDTVYEKHMYEFINQIRYSQFDYPRTDTLLIRNFLSNKSMFSGVSFVAIKKSHPHVLSEEEFHELSNQFHDDTTRFCLKENGIEKSKFISDNAVRKLESSQEFREKYCTYWKISKPCFLRNYTICVFSYTICDSQSTLLYQKVNDKWVYVAKLGGITNDY